MVPSDEDTLAHKCRVQGVPVYVALVPVLLIHFSKKDSEGFNILRLGDNQHAVAFLQRGLPCGQNNAIFPPDTTHDEMLICEFCTLYDSFPEDCWITDFKRGDVGLIRVAFHCVFRILVQIAFDEHQSNDNAHHTYGIGHGQGESSVQSVARMVHLAQSLLCSRQSRRVGCGATEHSHHFAQGAPSEEDRNKRGDSANKDERQAK